MISLLSVQVQIVYYHFHVLSQESLSGSQMSLLCKFFSPENPNFSLPYLQNVDGKLVLKVSDKYFTQCKM